MGPRRRDVVVAAAVMLMAVGFYRAIAAGGTVPAQSPVLALPPPEGVSVADGARAVAIRWKAVPGARSYRVLRVPQGLALVRATVVGTTQNTHLTDTSVREDTAYTYWIRAVAGRVMGAPSQPVHVTTTLDRGRLRGRAERALVSVSTYTEALPIATARGGGFIAPGGLVVTADRLVRRSHWLIDVVLANGALHHARTRAAVPSEDLAALSLDGPVGRGAAPLAPDGSLAVGAEVLCPNPPGGPASLAEGRVVGLHRAATVGKVRLTDAVLTGLHLTGASFGAPLFDPWGRIVGMIAGTAPGGDAIALPVRAVKGVLVKAGESPIS